MKKNFTIIITNSVEETAEVRVSCTVEELQTVGKSLADYQREWYEDYSVVAYESANVGVEPKWEF